ncbi:MAG TPA: valine--pyruvate transaminase [Allocoleopsis sp.]
MNTKLTQFGAQMSNLSGVRAIMKDIIDTLHASKGHEFINLSAGNPVIIPEVESLWRDYTKELLDSSDYGNVVCRYGSSQGYEPLIKAIVADFNQRYSLNLTEKNILITPGTQIIYFYASNAFGGYTNDGKLKKIVLPLSPDYTGYKNVSLTPQALIAYKPDLDIDETNHTFKYRPNFNHLSIDENVGCVIFSRPCNPSGNILTEDEVNKITALAAQFDIPVLIDSAYAPPFPALNYTDMNPIFGDNIIHCISLSKAGLPGERLGIAIGDESLIKVLESFQTNLCIHSSRYGQAIAAKAISSGKLAQLSTDVIRPHYKNKFAVLESALTANMSKDLPWFLHRGEGAIFAWLWLKDLPITDWQLYEKLKNVSIIVVPGSTFFPGLEHENWSHKQECIRISLTATDQEIITGMERLAQVVKEVYNS